MYRLVKALSDDGKDKTNETAGALSRRNFVALSVTADPGGSYTIGLE